MAEVIYQTLCNLDPEGRDYYTPRLNALTSRLDSLNNSWSERLDPLKGTSFMMWHPSLSYFAHDYGLHQVSVSAEHKETTPGKLRSIISMTDEKPVVFFAQKGYDPRISAIVTESLGIPIVEFNPLDYDWQTQLENVVDAITNNSPSPKENEH